MNNPLKELRGLGQSPWFDYIRRDMLASGEFARLMREDGLRGVTSNPTIFEKAISAGAEYDPQIKELAQAGVRDPLALFEALAVRDIGRAADLLLPVYRSSKGEDGYVSLEVSPTLARDSAGTAKDALRLFAELGRPNVMIKIPATREGLPAITKAIAAGVNVNVTLIFSLERYEAVVEAYLKGLEARARAGKPVKNVASVASFFVSRIDTAADKELEAKGRKDLQGKAAVANAKLAYAFFRRAFGSARFLKLKKKGARVQRPLWASTGTKNPAYSDVLYVETLVGPDTVNTMPPATWEAYRDHGRPRRTVDQGLPEAEKALADLAAAGVSLAAITDRLEAEGVKSFADSFDSLLKTLASKAAKLSIPAAEPHLGRHGTAAAEALGRLDSAKAVERLWAKDASLWKADPKDKDIVADSLGWLASPQEMRKRIGELERFASEVRKAGIKRVLLLGMGGSSLAPEVFSRVFGSAKGFPSLDVLDSTDPEAVAAMDRRAGPEKTLYLVASKSGTTAEPLRLFDYFWANAEAALGRKAGSRFAAITDPGSHLERLAEERGFRKTFLNFPDIGGRYSALSYFGLVPAALIGVDLEALLARVGMMACHCARKEPAADNPGAWLGAAVVALARAGKDKLTLLLPPELESLGLWLEQLVAESTGQEGKGVVPIFGESAPERWSEDRLFVHVRLKSSKDRKAEREAERARAAGHPLVRIEMKDELDLGSEFFRWETATAVMGHLMALNVFDQPDVESAKVQTKELLSRIEREGRLAPPAAQAEEGGVSISLSPAARTGAALADFLALAKPGEYVALLPYLTITGTYAKELKALAAALGRDGRAVQFGYGPRYLHSTGQLHKGGPDNGLFLILVREGGKELRIPGQKYSFNQLIAAQAQGDFQALCEKGRRAVYIRLSGNVSRGITYLTKMITDPHLRTVGTR